jgi:hypothetical protein
VREGEGVTFKPPKGNDPEWADPTQFVPVEVPAGTSALFRINVTPLMMTNNQPTNHQPTNN